MHYKSFRHESTRLQAVRLAYLIERNRTPWKNVDFRRENYNRCLDSQWDNQLKQFCLFKAKISKVYFLSPPDLVRWGGEFPPWHIGEFHRSRMLPTQIVITACSDEDVDRKLREQLIVTPKTHRPIGHVEILSWFGYTHERRQKTRNRALGDEQLPLRLLGKDPLPEMVDLFTQVALIFFQHRKIDNLTDIAYVFSGLDVLNLKHHTAHPATTWTPLLCGLLKGNIDGFLLMGKGNQPNLRDQQAEELCSFLADRFQQEEKKIDSKFWRKVVPVAAYFASAMQDDVVQENLRLLERLPLPVQRRR